MARRPKYKFAKKEYARNGKISAWISLTSAVLFLVSVMISFAFGGVAGVYVGGIGLASMLLSLFGFFQGIKGYSEKDCSHLFCMVGMIANGMICILYLALYAAGVS